MTKKDVVIALAEKNGLPRNQVYDAVQMIFDGIIDTLVTEGRIELRNFRVFQVKKRNARMARNLLGRANKWRLLSDWWLPLSQAKRWEVELRN
jgi:nucleoid DNA-binding protein